MSEPFVGEIRCFGFNFAPRDWALCNGQLMAISQNPALYSILGTTYGGDGTTTFALPDLRGQAPMHWGTGSDGTQTVIGEVQGQSAVTLLTSEIPRHTHQIVAADPGTAANRVAAPTNQSYLSSLKGSLLYQKPPVTPTAIFSPRAISLMGGSLQHDNMQPYVTINFSIALFGVFPSRN
jgi:microcystin-dependent protein